MALYTPMNGWDGKVMVLRQGASQPFLDASEIYGITWEENYNPERRKQLGTRSPGYLAGRYEANGSATGYFITGNMTKELYGQGGTKTALRDHAARGMKEFNIYIDFVNFPIRLNDTGPVDLIGYALVGCLLDTDSFELQEGQYVEKPLRFQIKNIIERYVGDLDSDIAPFLA